MLCTVFGEIPLHGIRKAALILGKRFGYLVKQSRVQLVIGHIVLALDYTALSLKPEAAVCEVVDKSRPLCCDVNHHRLFVRQFEALARARRESAVDFLGLPFLIVAESLALFSSVIHCFGYKTCVVALAFY